MPHPPRRSPPASLSARAPMGVPPRVLASDSLSLSRSAGAAARPPLLLVLPPAPQESTDLNLVNDHRLVGKVDDGFGDRLWRGGGVEREKKTTAIGERGGNKGRGWRAGRRIGHCTARCRSGRVSVCRSGRAGEKGTAARRGRGRAKPSSGGPSPQPFARFRVRSSSQHQKKATTTHQGERPEARAEAADENEGLRHRYRGLGVENVKG